MPIGHEFIGEIAVVSVEPPEGTSLGWLLDELEPNDPDLYANSPSAYDTMRVEQHYATPTERQANTLEVGDSSLVEVLGRFDPFALDLRENLRPQKAQNRQGISYDHLVFGGRHFPEPKVPEKHQGFEDRRFVRFRRPLQGAKVEHPICLEVHRGIATSVPLKGVGPKPGQKKGRVCATRINTGVYKL